MARIVKQDDDLRQEFLKRIQAKVAADKEAMKDRVDEHVPSLIAKVLKPIFGVAFDFGRGMDKFKGNTGEGIVSYKLKSVLSDDWILMNDVIVEPEPEVFAQTDHVLIGPPGIFIIETKAWEGAFTGFKDKWKRKEGNKWLACSSPTIQNYRHVKLIRKWLDGTGLVKVDMPAKEWVHAAAVFTNVAWLKTDGCCMPIFDGVSKLVSYLKEQRERKLSTSQIEKITVLLESPAVAKAFINKQVKVMHTEEDIARFEIASGRELVGQIENGQEQKGLKEEIREDNISQGKQDKSSQVMVTKIEEGKSKNGKLFIRITGTYEQAREVRENYLKDGKNPGEVNKDRFKAGVFYFYLGG